VERPQGEIARGEYALFLRPFVTKLGKPVESMGRDEPYYYKIYWDVRFPETIDNAAARQNSCLRIRSVRGDLFEWEQGMGRTNPPNTRGL
jgi:hypothetical protein